MTRPLPDTPAPRAPDAAPPSLAPHYERIVIDRQLKAGRTLAAVMGIGRGHRVLELGCGTGLLSEHLARRVGHEGEVLGLDPMPLRVQIAHQKSGRNLRFQVGDAAQPAQLARFGAGSFDAIVANGVLPSWPDAPASLAECWRLLAPGGRLGLVTPAADHPHPARVVQARVLAQVPYLPHPLPLEARDHPLDEAQLRAALRAAEFDELLLEAQHEVVLHASGRGAIEFMQASAWGRFLMHLPEALRASAHAEILAGLDALRGPEGIRFEAVTLVAIGCKPAPRHTLSP
jgi:arsenite methyltransferase